MAFFLAKIIYQVICGDGDHTPQFDEQFRLIASGDYTTAINKAKMIGLQEQHSFYNQKQKLVQWKFIDVCELYIIDDYADGTEIISTIRERYDAHFYIEEVHQKALKLQQHEPYSFLQAY
ncbi:MAG: DUF4288 domain-containing protein [Bacteroidota bacterium]